MHNQMQKKKKKKSVCAHAFKEKKKNPLHHAMQLCMLGIFHIANPSLAKCDIIMHPVVLIS